MIRRWIFNIAAAVSLLICLAVIGFWITTYRRAATVGWGRIHFDRFGISLYRVRFVAGEIHVTDFCTDGPTDNRLTSSIAQSWGQKPALTWSRNDRGSFYLDDFTGFHFFRGRPARRDIYSTMDLPCWAAALATAVLPSVWLIFCRPRVKRRGGYCSTCSYNLTANTSGVCPECGTPVPPKSEALA